jgi:hypothetical protein
VRSIVRRALVVGALVSAGAGAALLFTSGARARIVDVYVVVLAAVVMLALFRAIRLVAPPRPSGFEYALTRLRAPRNAQSAELPEERDVVLSRLSVFHYYIRVRPVLREIADHRLRSRFGIDLEREPERARELVPSPAWEVVRPDARPPVDRLARGPSVDAQREVVEALEGLGS